MKKKFASFILILMLSGCIGQAPAPVQTETPSPTQTPSPTPFDSSRQIAELENYGTSLGLSQEILQILRSAYSGGKASEEYKALVKDVMLSISKIRERYGNYGFRVLVTKRVMEDMRITDEDKNIIIEYEKILESNVTQTEGLKKDDFTLEDGKQTDLEKSYLANPNNSKLDEDLRNYYLEEIEKIYPDVSKELKKLPELSTSKVDKQSLEALEDIYGLLLTAKPYKNYNDRFKSNIPKENETWEAFELMISGGTPDSKDYSYEVPKYNTKIQALLWIAEQNEFKKNDTLAQSIAMDNGLYITMGDEQVRAAIYKDTNDLLKFFRDTNMWQLEKDSIYLKIIRWKQKFH